MLCNERESGDHSQIFTNKGEIEQKEREKIGEKSIAPGGWRDGRGAKRWAANKREIGDQDDQSEKQWQKKQNHRRNLENRTNLRQFIGGIRWEDSQAIDWGMGQQIAEGAAAGDEE